MILSANPLCILVVMVLPPFFDGVVHKSPKLFFQKIPQCMMLGDKHGLRISKRNPLERIEIVARPRIPEYICGNEQCAHDAILASAVADVVDACAAEISQIGDLVVRG